MRLINWLKIEQEAIPFTDNFFELLQKFGDIDYLGELINKKFDIILDDITIVKLYNAFSEEVWSASWKDNAEGQFIEWLESQ